MSRATIEDFIQAVAEVKDGVALLAKMKELQAVKDKLAGYTPVVNTLEDAKQVYADAKVYLEEVKEMKVKFAKEQKAAVDAFNKDVAEERAKVDELRQTVKRAMDELKKAQDLQISSHEKLMVKAKQMEKEEQVLAQREGAVVEREKALEEKVKKLNALVGV